MYPHPLLPHKVSVSALHLQVVNRHGRSPHRLDLHCPNDECLLIRCDQPLALRQLLRRHPSLSFYPERMLRCRLDYFLPCPDRDRRGAYSPERARDLLITHRACSLIPRQHPLPCPHRLYRLFALRCPHQCPRQKAGSAPPSYIPSDAATDSPYHPAANHLGPTEGIAPA